MTTTVTSRATPAEGNATYENVACPFCGLLCDDLVVARTGAALKALRNGCARATAGFERALPAATPMLSGKTASLDEAVKEAARLIKSARQPMISGLATDVEGARAAMALADRAGAAVDHALSPAQVRNFRVLQTRGWITTTLTEARNRADLMLIVGSDVHRLHPRFFERIVAVPDTMFTPTRKRTVVFIGQDLDTSGAQVSGKMGPGIAEVLTLACANERAGEILAALGARLKGARIAADNVAGVPIAAIDALAERCRKAAYGVVVWAPQALNFPDGDLTVHTIADVVRDLNQTQRFAGLSLGGNEGAVSAAAVCGWQAGFPLRVNYKSGVPDYDPLRFSTDAMLASGDADLLVWVASISADLSPPATDVPMVVLGTPGLALKGQPAVFIPVGTPGLDHAGRMVRLDNVVSLPMKNLGRTALPRAADVLAAIHAAL